MGERIFLVVMIDIQPGPKGFWRAVLQNSAKLFSLPQVMVFQIIPSDIDEVEVKKELRVLVLSGQPFKLWQFSSHEAVLVANITKPIDENFS